MQNYGMRVRSKPFIVIVLAILFVLWELIGQPLWNLNVERVAEHQQIDEVLRDALPTLSGGTMSDSAVEWIDYLTGPFLTGFVLGALIFGLWDWIARGLLTARKYVGQALGRPMRIVEMTKPTLKTFDHDVVAKGLFVRAKRTDDGIDIFPIVVYRNRSTHTIEIKEPKAKYTLDNKKPDRSYSHGFTATIGKMGDANVQFRPVRIYNQDGRASGKVLVQFTYGKTKETAQTTIIMRYEFKTLAPPKEADKDENVAFEYESDIKYERFDNP